MELILHIIIFIVILASIILGCCNKTKFSHLCLVTLILYLILVINFYKKKNNIENFYNSKKKNMYLSKYNMYLSTYNIGSILPNNSDGDIKVGDLKNKTVYIKITLNCEKNVTIKVTDKSISNRQILTISFYGSGTNINKQPQLFEIGPGKYSNDLSISIKNLTEEPITEFNYSIETMSAAELSTEVQKFKINIVMPFSKKGKLSNNLLAEEEEMELEYNEHEQTVSLRFDKLKLNEMSETDKLYLKEQIIYNLLLRGITVELKSILLKPGSVIALFPISGDQINIIKQILENNELEIELNDMILIPEIDLLNRSIQSVFSSEDLNTLEASVDDLYSS